MQKDWRDFYHNTGRFTQEDSDEEDHLEWKLCLIHKELIKIPYDCLDQMIEEKCEKYDTPQTSHLFKVWFNMFDRDLD